MVKFSQERTAMMEQMSSVMDVMRTASMKCVVTESFRSTRNVMMAIC